MAAPQLHCNEAQLLAANRRTAQQAEAPCIVCYSNKTARHIGYALAAADMRNLNKPSTLNHSVSSNYHGQKHMRDTEEQAENYSRCCTRRVVQQQTTNHYKHT
jgi:fructose/tagatose bisphosphate aldolase